MDVSKYEEMLKNLTKQEAEVKATFTKIQGAKEVVSALIEEAKSSEGKGKVAKAAKSKAVVDKIDNKGK
tara:strand:+ start:17330 stop:17536 length:207 start_codon:yes stop_codon:yes gene_type:complete